MRQVSLKKNFVFNLLNTVIGLLFPLITFPYVSRILFAEGIGQIQFYISIIDYIALCTSLGIPLYAVREIAKIRDNKALVSKTTAEILILHALLTFGGYIIVLILVSTVGKIQVDIPLFLILSISLFFNAIGAPWFYQAFEDFKYITIRSLIVRLGSLIALFILVKEKQDLLIYALITVIANVGSNIFNFIRLRKYIDLHGYNLRNLSPMKHLKPAIQIFILNLIVSIYVNLNTVMLGFMKSEQSVGYFTAAINLTKVILGIVTSFGNVLLPRFSNMIGSGQMIEFNLLARKSISFTIALSLPMTIGMIFLAAPIIHLFCGKQFEPSILSLQMVSPIILFIGLSGILGMQILYPLGKEKIVMIATGFGAITNFILNYLLIPHYAQYGAAIATTIAEFVVIAIMIIVSKKYISFKIISRQNIHYIIASTLIFLVLIYINYLNLNDLLHILIGIPISILIYTIYLYFIKDPFTIQVTSMISNAKNKNNEKI